MKSITKIIIITSFNLGIIGSSFAQECHFIQDYLNAIKRDAEIERKKTDGGFYRDFPKVATGGSGSYEELVNSLIAAQTPSVYPSIDDIIFEVENTGCLYRGEVIVMVLNDDGSIGSVKDAGRIVDIPDGDSESSLIYNSYLALESNRYKKHKKIEFSESFCEVDSIIEDITFRSAGLIIFEDSSGVVRGYQTLSFVKNQFYQVSIIDENVGITECASQIFSN